MARRSRLRRGRSGKRKKRLKSVEIEFKKNKLIYKNRPVHFKTKQDADRFINAFVKGMVMTPKEASKLMPRKCEHCKENLALARKLKKKVLVRPDTYDIIGVSDTPISSKKKR